MDIKRVVPTLSASFLIFTQMMPAQNSGMDARTPNFIIINCDDLGYGDLGCFGHPTIKTPNLDRMACDGQRWTSFYVSSAVSSPSRAGLLTGRLGVRTGMYGNNREVLFPDSPEGLPAYELTIAELLKTAGYTTACVGKWHVGHQEESMPLQNGFDFFYGIPYSNDMSKKEQLTVYNNPNYSTVLPFYNQKEIIETEPDQTQLTKRLTEYAVSFISKQKENPFFLYLAHPMPHVPLYASEDFQGKSLRGKYGDAVDEIDWSVGRIMQTLINLGLDNNTLVIFTSDNGPWLSFKQDGGSAGLLKDGKASTYEGGFRVPMIAWGNNILPATIPEMGSTLDLLPTFCEIAGVPLPADREYDGMSLAGVLFNEEYSPREYFAFFRGSELYAYRDGDYKIHLITRPAYGSNEKTTHLFPLLYNMVEDPGELYDLSAKYPDVVERLVEEAERFLWKITIEESIFDKR